jgi:hypothetical protein
MAVIGVRHVISCNILSRSNVRSRLPVKPVSVPLLPKPLVRPPQSQSLYPADSITGESQRSHGSTDPTSLSAKLPKPPSSINSIGPYRNSPRPKSTRPISKMCGQPKALKWGSTERKSSEQQKNAKVRLAEKLSRRLKETTRCRAVRRSARNCFAKSQRFSRSAGALSWAAAWRTSWSGQGFVPHGEVALRCQFGH